MDKRLARINKHIQRTFGEILMTEAQLPDDVLVTVSRAEASDNMQAVAIWLVVSPADRAEAVMAALSSQLYDLQGALNRALDRKLAPRISLMIDYEP